MNRETLIHLIAGGVGGTTGAVATCPLEVVKTRLQSSQSIDYRSTGNFGGSNDFPSSSSKGKGASSTAQARKSSGGPCTRATFPCHEPVHAIPRWSLPSLAPANFRAVSSGVSGTWVSSASVTSSSNAAQIESIRSACSSCGDEQRLLRQHRISRLTPNSNSSRMLCHFNATSATVSRPTMIRCFRTIVREEGALALWKGLIPTVCGVAPSRAVYFMVYSNAKKFLNRLSVSPDTALVHMGSAGFAGFVTCSLTNPIWFIKTRLQLDHSVTHGRIRRIIRKAYQENGFKGFYRGVQASYVGISETIIHFVIYEHLKALVLNGGYRSSSSSDSSDNNNGNGNGNNGHRDSWTFLTFMLCGGFSKMVASSIAYPHELARTRLREEGHKYRRFFQTIVTVKREEGFRGLYRGLGIHLLRQIPNTAILMGTYEIMVYALS